MTFTGANDIFSIVPTATGTVQNDGVFLTVSLDRFTSRTNGKFNSPRRILGYRIGLVRSTESAQWKVIRSSSTVATNFTPAPGQTFSAGAYKAEIPIDGLTSLRGDRLVIVVDVQTDGQMGNVYAHSQNWRAP